jgi:hypothetical protein
LRRRLIDKMAGKVEQAAEEEVRTWFTDQHGK